MLRKIQAAAEARRAADLAALSDLRQRLSELVSPETAAMVGAMILRRAIVEGLECDLSIGIGAGALGSELAMEATLAAARITPETIAQIEAMKPTPPRLLAPFVERLEEALGWLIADLARRKADLQGAPRLFSAVEVSGTVGVDLQVASVSVTVTASWGG